MMTARFERRQLKRWFFYVDVLVIGVFALALVMLVRDAYTAGFYEAVSAFDIQSAMFWAMLRDVAFLVGSLSWIFYRFFKNSAKELSNPWS